MKKHLPLISAIAIITVIVGGAFWWRQLQPQITLDQAKQLAMKDSKLLINEVDFFKAKLERESGKMLYKLSFKARQTTYEYQIDAVTQQIISKNSELISASTSTQPTASSQNPSLQPNSNLIGEIKAKTIALQDAGLTEVSIDRYRWKLDYENNTQVYELEFDHGAHEYDYEINALTGQIIKKQQEIKHH